MSRNGSLDVLLMVRRHREQMEERRLAEAVARLERAGLELARLDAEAQDVARMRLSTGGHLTTAWEYQQQELRLRDLRTQHERMSREKKRLEQIKDQQCSAYLAARCGRDAIGELLAQRTAAAEAEAERRDQGRLEELLIARRPRL